MRLGRVGVSTGSTVRSLDQLIAALRDAVTFLAGSSGIGSGWGAGFLGTVFGSAVLALLSRADLHVDRGSLEAEVLAQAAFDEADVLRVELS